MPLTKISGTTIGRTEANSFLHRGRSTVENEDVLLILQKIRQKILAERTSSTRAEFRSEAREDYVDSYVNEENLENFEKMDSLHMNYYF